MRTLMILLLLASPAWGQKLKDMKTEYEQGDAIVLTIDMEGVPDGAVIQPGFRFKVKTDAGKHEIKEPVPGTYYMWAAGGNYELTAVGMWGVPAGDGKWSAFGLIWEEVEFKVVGGTPPVPPPVAGPFEVMMFYDQSTKDNLPPEQRSILTSLTLRKWMISQKHVLLEVLESAVIQAGVPASYEPFVAAVKGKALPAVALRPVTGGPITVFPLPANSDAFKGLLNDPVQH